MELVSPSLTDEFTSLGNFELEIADPGAEAGTDKLTVSLWLARKPQIAAAAAHRTENQDRLEIVE